MENGMKHQAGGDSDTLAVLVRYFSEAEDATADSRAEAERCRDYRNGDQWTAEEIATLTKRKQPIVTIDRIGPKVDFLLGMESAQRTDPKAYPRTPNEEQGSEAATDALRYVMDASQWDQVRSEAFDQFIVEGVCGADVTVRDKGGEKQISVNPIMWDRMFFDPHSRARNFSDAKYKGQFVWMDLEDAERAWPESADILETTMGSESTGETFDDVPRLRWADPKRKRVRIVEMWTLEGSKVFHSTFTKAGILARMESPFVDEDGQPEDGFEFGSCYLDRDGNRFGVVRRWLSLQDEINKRRSKAMHLMNVRQTYGNALTGDKNKLKGELARPDGHVELEGDAKFGQDFGVIPTADMAQAQFQLLQEAKQEIDAVGVNAAMAGTEQRVMSGRALMARQESGNNELGPIFDWFRSWQLSVYRKVWNRVRQYWTAEKWVRVTDDERNVRFVGLNQPMTLGDQLLQEMQQQGREITPDMQQQAKMDPRLQQVVGIKNGVQEMDVDITLDVVPATASLQIEQFQTLAELVKSGVPIPPDALVEASSIRNKEKILESMRGGGKQDGAAAMQKLQQAEQEIRRLQAELQQATSGIATEQAKGQNAQALEAMRGDLARGLQAQKDEAAQVLQSMKDDAAHDREELKAWKDIVLQKMQPPPALAAEVAQETQAT